MVLHVGDVIVSNNDRIYGIQKMFKYADRSFVIVREFFGTEKELHEDDGMVRVQEEIVKDDTLSLENVSDEIYRELLDGGLIDNNIQK